MFTGIICNFGTVVKRQRRQGQLHLSFRLEKEETDLKEGDSLAVDGVCLTAAGVRRSFFEADVIDETLAATTLGSLVPGDRVNLERSMKYGDAFNGHFVSGHIDGTGQIVSVKKKGRNRILQIQTPKVIIARLALKGSITCNGVSLTIQSLAGSHFTVALTPYTLRVTTFGEKMAGDQVNVENDLILKYLEAIYKKAASRAPGRKLRLLSLIKQGF